MGEPLQTAIDEGTGSLSEKAVLQLALRLVSVPLNDFTLRIVANALAMPFSMKRQYINRIYVFCSWIHLNLSTRRNMPMQTSMQEIFTSTLTVTQRSVSMSLMN